MNILTKWLFNGILKNPLNEIRECCRCGKQVELNELDIITSTTFVIGAGETAIEKLVFIEKPITFQHKKCTIKAEESWKRRY